MPRINDLTPAQKHIAQQMRNLRLGIGMSTPKFGQLIRMDSSNINARELHQNPWREAEIRIALIALSHHLQTSIKQIELIRGSLTSPTANK